jgi:hypothetical protein
VLILYSLPGGKGGWAGNKTEGSYLDWQTDKWQVKTMIEMTVNFIRLLLQCIWLMYM